LEAVNILIASPNAHEQFEAVETISRIAAIHPIKLTGEGASMNALLKLRVSDPAAYERVLELVEKRRADLGYDALRTPKGAGYDKVEYMRQFMDQKRERQRLAAEIENMLRSDRDKLVGSARLEFMRRQSAKWKLQRDAFLERARAGLGTKSLDKEQMQAALAQFWSAVDEELEARHAAAKAELLKPAGKRHVPDVQLDVLLAALKFDPYKKEPPAR